ncbi:MAG: MATE family efflux transporter [Nocardioidaceae bacterium]
MFRPRWTDTDREIARLAVPAFAALVSEPLFLLADTAVVGHLGTAPLAGLTIASTILLTVVGLAIFLAYGTTASVARHLGADDLRGAITTGIAGGWLALLIGVGSALVLVLAGPGVIGWFGAGAPVRTEADHYLRVAAYGLPAMLMVLAATGILRGLQDTRTPLVVAVTANLANIALNVTLVYGAGLGIAGSALGTVVAQLGSALALVVVIARAARRHEAALVPHWSAVAEAARVGVPLIIRTFTLRAALLLGTYVASTMPDASIAAHQITATVVNTLAFALDAIAIAGQAMTGRSLGARDVPGVRRATARMLGWAVWGGTAGTLGLMLVAYWLPLVFTGDQAVRAAAFPALVVVALIQPVSGVVFVLDGVLIGAGDGSYLARAGVVTFVVYAPLALLVLVLGAGLGWLWAAYAGFILARMVTLVRRERSQAWLVTGAPARA